jgi:hypothetical protein
MQIECGEISGNLDDYLLSLPRIIGGGIKVDLLPIKLTANHLSHLLSTLLPDRIFLKLIINFITHRLYLSP